MPNSLVKVMLLDGGYRHTLQIARELVEDLPVEIVGVGGSHRSYLLRSKYCAVAEVAGPAGAPDYPARIEELVHRYQPDFLLPVGYKSVETVVGLAPGISTATKMVLPSESALRTTLSKRSTLEVARRLGIGCPGDYSMEVKAWLAAEPSQGGPDLPYPVFLKASLEAGKNITAVVPSATQFAGLYGKVVAEADGGDVLVQEYIRDDTVTYGCGVLRFAGDSVLHFAHEELRSVPRTGGSGTRVRTYFDEHLEEMSTRLLAEIGWEGVALVEYKRRQSGDYVLMEVNPKFWASYTLASRTGHRFASTSVRLALPGLRVKQTMPRTTGCMVFPIREFGYYARNRSARSESLLRSIKAMVWPPASFDVDVGDLRAWLP